MMTTNEAVLITDPHYDACPVTERYGEGEEPHEDEDVDPASDRISAVHDMGSMVYAPEQEAAFYTEHCADDDDIWDFGNGTHEDINDEAQ